MEEEFVVEHIHTDLLLTEEHSNEEEIIEEIEFAEEGVAFNNSWIGPDILPFFAENCSFNPKLINTCMFFMCRYNDTRLRIVIPYNGQTRIRGLYLYNTWIGMPHQPITIKSIQQIYYFFT